MLRAVYSLRCSLFVYVMQSLPILTCTNKYGATSSETTHRSRVVTYPIVFRPSIIHVVAAVRYANYLKFFDQKQFTLETITGPQGAAGER